MISLVCLSRNKNKNGHIVSYKLKDAFGNVRDIKASALKEAINNGTVSVQNLTMTSNGKLIEKKVENENDTVTAQSPIERFLLRCRLLGININEFNFSPDFSKLISFNTRSNTKDIIVPPVKIIGKQCFEFANTTGNVIIPDGVEVIEDNAFSSANIGGEIKLPNTLKKIGDAAFLHANVKSIIVPDSVTSIGDRCFSSSEIEAVKLGAGITEIPDNCFFHCDKIVSMNIPDNIKSIKKCAFESCIKLQQVTIPESVISIGMSAFKYCSSLTKIELPSRLASLGDHAFSLHNEYFGGNQRSESEYIPIIIKSNIIKIGNRAFSDRNILSLQFNEEVESLGVKAFRGTKFKCSVVLPKQRNRAEIGGRYAFEKSEIPSVCIPSHFRKICNFMFKDANIGNVIIEDGVEAIGISAFENATVSKISIPDTIDYIYNSAFLNSKINGLSVPINAMLIGDMAYANTGLTGSLTFDRTMLIGYAAFANCNLDTIELGRWFYVDFDDGSNGAFACCCKQFVVSPDNEKFKSLGKVLCDHDEKNIYACAKTNIQELNVPNSVERIYSYAFANIDTLRSVIINHVVKIDDYAFAYCKKIKKIRLKKGTKYTALAFKGSIDDKIDIELT